MILRRLVIGTLLLALCGPAHAELEGNATAQSEEKDLADLLSIVKQETDVATKTRMNSDYVPGIVTVLEGDELEALGVTTVGEALGLVPGMYSVLDDRSTPLVIVRGLDFPFNSGNIQILLNGVPITRPDAGVNTATLLMPVQQVDRIEVIRGPGSVIYGDFAFMGLVNIITRKDGTRIFARQESPHPGTDVGARWAMKPFSINVSRFSSDNAIVRLPSPNADDHRTFLIASFEKSGFSATAQMTQRTFKAIQAPGVDDHSWVVQGKYNREISKALQGEVAVNYLHNDANDTAFSGRGHVAKFATSVIWNGLPHQSILAGGDYTSSVIDKARASSPPPPGQPPVQRIVATNAERDITGVTLQDRVDLRDSLSLTLGARYDSYSDLSSRVTPRVAVVWRATENHIIKAQYAEGFRPPTFFELYLSALPGTGTLPGFPFEVNTTTELNYSYRGPERAGRITIFHTTLHDLLHPGGFLPRDAHAEGAEFEWGQQITQKLKIDTNASYAETVDPRAAGLGNNPNAVSPEWLSNVALLYRPWNKFLFGARWNHIDKRPAGKGYELVDLTISRQDVIVPGLDVRIGVKNTTNSRVSFLQQRPTGGVAQSVFPGRAVWLQLSWKP